jgi:hypothetical protein
MIFLSVFQADAVCHCDLSYMKQVLALVSLARIQAILVEFTAMIMGCLAICHSVFVQRSFRHKYTVLAAVSLTKSVGYIYTAE